MNSNLLLDHKLSFFFPIISSHVSFGSKRSDEVGITAQKFHHALTALNALLADAHVSVVFLCVGGGAMMLK